MRAALRNPSKLQQTQVDELLDRFATTTNAERKQAENVQAAQDALDFMTKDLARFEMLSRAPAGTVNIDLAPEEQAALDEFIKIYAVPAPVVPPPPKQSKPSVSFAPVVAAPAEGDSKTPRPRRKTKK